MKAIRGATTVAQNTMEAIDEATQELLRAIFERNDLAHTDIVSLFFSVTPDLDAAFPARSARAMGIDVPMLDLREMDVRGALPRCVRVLMHVEHMELVRHAYLRDAYCLRPDLEDGS